MTEGTGLHRTKTCANCAKPITMATHGQNFRKQKYCNAACNFEDKRKVRAGALLGQGG